MTDAPSSGVALLEKKPRKITRAIRQAINLLATGECKTKKAAAVRAGITPEHFSRMLRRPEVSYLIDHEARRNLAEGKLRASARLLELIDADSAHVAFDASRHVLGIAGIAPPERGTVQVNLGIAAGYIIDLSGRQDEANSAHLSGRAPTTVIDQSGKIVEDLPADDPSNLKPWNLPVA